MATNVEVTRKKNESSLSTIKRFTRRMQESGVLNRVRSIRYSERDLSDYTKKKARLKSIRKTEEFQKLYKLGKISGGRRGRRR